MPRRAADGKRPRSSIPAAAFLDRQPSPGPGLQDELALAAPAGWDYKYTVVWRSNARPRLSPKQGDPDGPRRTHPARPSAAPPDLARRVLDAVHAQSRLQSRSE